jgi:hypothetical protein
MRIGPGKCPSVRFSNPKSVTRFNARANFASSTSSSSRPKAPSKSSSSSTLKGFRKTSERRSSNGFFGDCSFILISAANLPPAVSFQTTQAGSPDAALKVTEDAQIDTRVKAFYFNIYTLMPVNTKAQPDTSRCSSISGHPIPVAGANPQKNGTSTKQKLQT